MALSVFTAWPRLRASMPRVEVVGVDPRDTEFEVDERRLLGAPDVRAALDWAEQHVGRAGPNSTYTVYVEARDGGRPGLILWAGSDPTERP